MSSTHRAPSTVTRVLLMWTESSPMVTTRWLTVEFPCSSFLLRCTENSWKALWQSDTRLYSHVPGNWKMSPSNVLKCWLPQVLQMLLTWFRTGNDMDRTQMVTPDCKHLRRVECSYPAGLGPRWEARRGNTTTHFSTPWRPRWSSAQLVVSRSSWRAFIGQPHFPFPPPILLP